MSLAEQIGADGVVVERMQTADLSLRRAWRRLLYRLFRWWFLTDVGGAMEEVEREGEPAKRRHIANMRRASRRLYAASEAQMTSAMAGLEVQDFPSDSVRGVTLAPSGAREVGVVLYVPGGSFIAERSPKITAMVARMAKAADARLCIVDYRLSPEHPCPAAVEDVRAAYEALLALYPPEKIAIGAESSGAGIMLAALQQARDAGRPMPAAMVLLSPWVDLTLSSWSVVSRSLTADSPFSMELLALCAQIYLDGFPAVDPIASPIYGDLAGLPPALIHASEADLLFDDAQRLAAGLRRAGGLVTLRVWANEEHVFERLLKAEGEKSIREIGRFLRAHLTAGVG